MRRIKRKLKKENRRKNIYSLMDDRQKKISYGMKIKKKQEKNK